MTDSIAQTKILVDTNIPRISSTDATSRASES